MERDLSLARVQHLYAYHVWRVGQLCAVLAPLDVEALAAPVPGSFPTLGRLVGHLIGAEQVWQQRISRGRQGLEPIAIALPDQPTQNAAALVAAWQQTAAAWAPLLAGLSAADLAGQLAYLNLKGERYETRLDDMLLHLVNHATYHSGQVTLLYRLLGLEAVNTDYITYVRQQKA